jgi:maleylacetoacetate isomerase/maleylpyruvate isomerase
MSLVLYSFWRATAPYRVRIGLNLKGVAYDYAAVNLTQGAQHKAAYRTINPQRMTPALDIGETTLTQSLAILEWLEETQPEPPLLPSDPLGRAQVRAMAGIIACDIHPLNNARVVRALETIGVDAPSRQKWVQRWITDGFVALEPMIARLGDGFAYGATPTLADCCLIPQVYSAERFAVDLTPYPAIRAVAGRAAAHPAFIAAHPEMQPDFT